MGGDGDPWLKATEDEQRLLEDPCSQYSYIVPKPRTRCANALRPLSTEREFKYIYIYIYMRERERGRDIFRFGIKALKKTPGAA